MHRPSNTITRRATVALHHRPRPLLLLQLTRLNNIVLALSSTTIRIHMCARLRLLQQLILHLPLPLQLLPQRGCIVRVQSNTIILLLICALLHPLHQPLHLQFHLRLHLQLEQPIRLDNIAPRASNTTTQRPMCVLLHHLQHLRLILTKLGNIALRLNNTIT